MKRNSIVLLLLLILGGCAHIIRNSCIVIEHLKEQINIINEIGSSKKELSNIENRLVELENKAVLNQQVLEHNKGILDKIGK